MVYIKLFVEFLKVGLFSFGGAYSSIPLIRDAALRNAWCSDEVLSNIIAVSESTPGAIIVNLSTYIGAMTGGILGAIIATFAAILPAFVLIIVFSKILNKYLSNPLVKHTLGMVRSSVVAVIISTGIFMFCESFNFHPGDASADNAIPIYKKLIVAAILIFLLIKSRLQKKKFNSVLFIIISAILGVVVFSFI